MNTTYVSRKCTARFAAPVILSLLALGGGAFLCPDVAAQTPPPQGVFSLDQTISDLAQRTTLAFAGLGMMTGNLEAQSFFPPGKVADYTGFQYLRDNDPDNMGHNTSFLTRAANNIIYILTDAQFNELKTLATAQIDQINLYGYKRFPLMKAFRRLMDGDIPAGSTGLNMDAVKEASRELYRIDGQISFDRALLYANILASMDETQIVCLDAMKGKGWGSWPDVTNTQVSARMRGLPQGTAVAVMTYASDLLSWYVGSVDADVYFCPERQGTYFGSFYIKDAPAIGHEGYSIDEQLTATAGSALCDSSKGYVTQAQATLISSLVDTQRNNLYASPTSSIVKVRTEIATLLRGLLVSTASSDSIEAQVLALSEEYGDLDGENNYYYATVFAQVYATLTDAQKTQLAALRQSIMSGTYVDGTPFDFSVCTTPYLYSSAITNLNLLNPYIADTDYLFFEPVPGEGEGEVAVEGEGEVITEGEGSLALSSTEVTDGGSLPVEYTCDGVASTLPLQWTGAPEGTVSYTMIMHHIAPDMTKWYWILYNIPAGVLSLPKNATGIGSLGTNSVNNLTQYEPPCSQGPGEKNYTYTLYALSAAPQLSVAPDQVTRDVMLAAMQGLILDSDELNVVYSRPGEGESEGEGEPPAGALTVTIQPAGAVTDGAQWSIDGGARWNDSGATLANLAPGGVFVSFKTVAGWIAPGNQTVTVNPDQTATLTAVFKQEPSTQYVTVPNVLGKTLAEAELLISDGGLLVGAIQETYIEAFPDGHVVYQDPAAGAKVATGGVVNLVVNRMPGEGEAPSDIESIRQQMTDSFDQVDTDGSGGLTFAEAAAVVTEITQAMFTELDTNGNGLLTPDELGMNTDSWFGCTGFSGCTSLKDAVLPGMPNTILGDLLLGALSLMVLQIVTQKRP